MKTARLFIAVAIAAAPLAATANTHQGHHAQTAAATSQSAAGFTEGEVRKIDAEQGKVTLKHGAIENIGMTPMTMVFKVADASMLPKLKVGDTVKFKAERVNGAYTVTEIAPAK